jgi:hypothetical protein
MTDQGTTPGAEGSAGTAPRPTARPVPPRRPAPKTHPLELPGLVALWTLTALLVGYVLSRALGYYLAPLGARPHLEADAIFRSSRAWGHGLGIGGGLVVLATLLYPLRKTWKKLRQKGRMAAWLRYHIWCGLAGPIFVTLHGTFKFGGLVAISYWSMVAVMVSGFIGRYIYAQIPRSIQGQELGERELAERDAALVAELRTDLAQDPNLLVDVEGLCRIPEGTEAKGWRLLLFSIRDDLSRGQRTRALKGKLQATHHYTASLVRDIVAIARRRSLLRRRIAVLHVSRDLFRHWHAIHRPFAFVMFGIAVVHVVVALLLGYSGVGK